MFFFKAFVSEVDRDDVSLRFIMGTAVDFFNPSVVQFAQNDAGFCCRLCVCYEFD